MLQKGEQTMAKLEWALRLKLRSPLHLVQQKKQLVVQGRISRRGA